MTTTDRIALDRIFHALRAAPGGERLSLFPHEYTSDEISGLAVGCIEALSEAVRQLSPLTTEVPK